MLLCSLSLPCNCWSSTRDSDWCFQKDQNVLMHVALPRDVLRGHLLPLLFEELFPRQSHFPTHKIHQVAHGRYLYWCSCLKKNMACHRCWQLDACLRQDFQPSSKHHSKHRVKDLLMKEEYVTISKKTKVKILKTFSLH